jgi:hypothetical protein
MTVNELIEELRRLPGQAVVVVQKCHGVGMVHTDFAGGYTDNREVAIVRFSDSQKMVIIGTGGTLSEIKDEEG